MPLLLTLIFACVEGGNYFLSEHALVKSVRDGARYGSRLPIATNYSCDPDPAVTPTAANNISLLTRTGTFDATADERRPYAGGEACQDGDTVVTVTVRCADVDTYPGLWRELGTDIPVVKVNSAVTYRSLLGQLGFGTTNLCLKAESEVPVIGL